MKMRLKHILTLAFGLAGCLHAADDAVFKSADGAKSFTGRPVEVVSLGKGIVRIARTGGGTVDSPVTAFSEADRAKLKLWMERESADPQVVVNRRLAAAAHPAVLFIGNSYSFQVPGVFSQIAKAEGKNVVVEQVTFGGWTLQRHAANPDTLAAIRKRKWDVIVLQEQSQVPAFLPEQRDSQMLPPLKSLVSAITESGALPALYQTWGRRDGDRENAAAFSDDTFGKMHQRLESAFALARKQNPNLTAVPVGAAWAERMKSDAGKALFNPQDGSHPSAQGNHLAAAVFFSALFNAKVTHKPANIPDAAALNELAFLTALHRPLAYPVAEGG
ncbi:MAG: hypothetical protein J0M04_09255 [Verrucomicrobia bacterium]|nr:hypothetical protein [Verrucomicrobiota bacterium]